MSNIRRHFIFVRHAAIGDASGTDDAGSSASGVHDPCLTISHTCIPSSQASQAMQTMHVAHRYAIFPCSLDVEIANGQYKDYLIGQLTTDNAPNCVTIS